MPGGSREALLAYAPLTFVLVGVNILAFPVVAEQAEPALGLTYTQSGLVTAAFALTYAAMQIPAGRMSDRWGGARVIRICVLASGGFALLFSFASDFASALIARVLLGAVVGAQVPATVQLLASYFRGRDLDRASGIFVAGWGGAQVLIFLAVPPIILGGDWRLGLHFVTGATFGVALAAWLLLPRRPVPASPSTTPPADPPGGTIFTRDMIALTLIHVSGLGLNVGVLAWVPRFVTTELQGGAIAAGIVGAILGVTNIAGPYVGGELARRVGRKPIVVASVLMAIVGVPLFTLTRDVVFASLVAAVVGWGTVFYSGPVFAQIPEASPRGARDTGLLFGVLNTVTNVGVFVTPFLFGLLLDLTGSFAAGFWALAAYATMGVIGALLFPRSPLRAPHPQ